VMQCSRNLMTGSSLVSRSPAISELTGCASMWITSAGQTTSQMPAPVALSSSLFSIMPCHSKCRGSWHWLDAHGPSRALLGRRKAHAVPCRAIPMDIATFLLAVLLLELTPGPNMAYLATLALSRGRAAGLVATVGVAFGLAVHAIVAGIGAGELIQHYPLLYEVLRWIGVGYLLYLAWE